MTQRVTTRARAASKRAKQTTRKNKRKREHEREKEREQLSPAKNTDQPNPKHMKKNEYNQPHPGPGGKLIINNETS